MAGDDRADHDHGYKLIFSQPEMVEDLLRGFVPGEWVDRLDFGSLQRVSGTYVTGDLREREDDIIWRVRLLDSWLYVYLLIEFQSTVDPFMALRMMVYLGLLYQDLVAQKELSADRRLPPVLPIVLYNGPKPWRAALEVSELIEQLPGLEMYVPHCRYLLLDEGQYPEGELVSSENLAAALFRLERAHSPEDVREVLSSLIDLLTGPSRQELRRAFTVWLRRVLIPARLGRVTIPETAELTEVRAMLAERVIEWTQQWKAEGKAEGRAEGRAEILLRQLEKKFGPLTSEQRSLVSAADEEALLAWADRILVAETLDEIFGG